MSLLRPEAASRSKLVWLLASVVAVVLLCLWSLSVGASDLSLSVLWQAFGDPQSDTREAVILWQVRLPRLLAALAAGAGLAVAGAIMQALTGNPLADPGLLGVNAGAAFAVVIVTMLTGGIATQTMVWVAFCGAGIAAVLVYMLGSLGRSGTTPVKLVLAGVILGSFLISITTAILLIDAQTLEEVRFWTVGLLRNRQMAEIGPLLPYLLAGLCVTMAVRPQFTSLSLGAEIAAGLGQNQALWRGVAAGLVVVLAGTSVSIAGPLGFVGLVVPHMVRFLTGADYRWILPFCVTGGAALTLLADALPRALWGKDIPLGVTMALIGAPVFIWLARRATSAQCQTVRAT